ncbi:hypothetical protein A3F37_02700 [Candidatus Saccharibacteria bacterium RIFCSPHIGHO2_12_FULL_41_12]|nr:MAG: hypothetical protein A3F37_02700 [Candidatus Saccharibacteria bacterium RIFCSPHIGHO2_12_FULL_41_12]
MKNFKQKSSFIIVPVLMFVAVGTLVFSGAVSAQTSTGGVAGPIKPNLTDINNCRTSLSAYDVASVKKYGKERADKRAKTVAKLEALINESSSKRDSTFNAKMSSIESIINKYGQNSNAQLDKSLPSGKAQLISEVNNSRTIVSRGTETIGATATAQDAANATCSMIYEAQIYSTLVNKVRAQIKLDNLSMRNSLNQARLVATNALYDSNQGDKEIGNKVKAHKATIAKLSSPKANSAGLESAQAKVNTGQDINSELQTLTQTITKTQGPQIASELSQVRNTIKSEITAKTKSSTKKSKTKSKGGTGGSAPTSGGSTKQTAKKKATIKKKATKREHSSHKGTECAKSGSGNQHCAAYQPQGKGESILYVNKRRADAQRKANKQAKAEDNAKKQAKENQKIEKKGNKLVKKLRGL